MKKNIKELKAELQSGTCVLRFIVQKDGSLRDFTPLTMKYTKLAEVAINALKTGPKWVPAEQNGQKVDAYYQQPVSLKIDR